MQILGWRGGERLPGSERTPWWRRLEIWSFTQLKMFCWYWSNTSFGNLALLQEEKPKITVSSLVTVNSATKGNVIIGLVLSFLHPQNALLWASLLFYCLYSGTNKHTCSGMKMIETTNHSRATVSIRARWWTDKAEQKRNRATCLFGLAL